MPIYSYKALKQGKEIISGEITASDYKDAKDLIRKMGLVPTELKEYVEKSIKEDKKSPEVIANDIKEMNFKTKMCARTIRNNIYAGDIYDITSKDMIYNKEYKEKTKIKKYVKKCHQKKV